MEKRVPYLNREEFYASLYAKAGAERHLISKLEDKLCHAKTPGRIAVLQRRLEKARKRLQVIEVQDALTRGSGPKDAFFKDQDYFGKWKFTV
jgi:hypothetical protein